MNRPIFNWSQISAFRLTRHHLADRHRTDLATVCQHVCGIQAQVMAAAEMQFWARRRDLTRAEIQAALREHRTVVKTSLMPGTLHLLPVADFPIYIRALKRSRVRDTLQVMSKYGGMTQQEAEGVTEAVVEALRAGPLTRRELTERIVALGIVGEKAKTWFEQGWGGSWKLRGKLTPAFSGVGEFHDS